MPFPNDDKDERSIAIWFNQ